MEKKSSALSHAVGTLFTDLSHFLAKKLGTFHSD